MPRKWVYRIGIIFIFFAVLQSPASYLIFGKVEKGRVKTIVFDYPGTLLLPSSAYPKIEFRYQNKSYVIQGEENDMLLAGEEVKVIFLKNKPEKAKIYSFSNLFINSMIQLPFGLLIWWALFKSFPNLFTTERTSIDFRNLMDSRRKRTKGVRIKEAHIVARIAIYSIIAVIICSLLYALWAIFGAMRAGALSNQTGVGISVIILAIIISIVHKGYKA